MDKDKDTELAHLRRLLYIEIMNRNKMLEHIKKQDQQIAYLKKIAMQNIEVESEQAK